MHTWENDDLFRVDHVEDEIRKAMNDRSSDSAADDLVGSAIRRDTSDRCVDLVEKFVAEASPAFLVPDERTLDVAIG